MRCNIRDTYKNLDFSEEYNNNFGSKAFVYKNILFYSFFENLCIPKNYISRFTNRNKNFSIDISIRKTYDAEGGKGVSFDTKKGGIRMIKADVLENGKVMVCENAVSDSVKFEKIKFNFPKEWSGYTKTAVFNNNDITLSVVLNSENELCTGENECYIPHEVIKHPCFTVSVFGIKGDSKATATRAIVNVYQSGYAEGDAPSDPTPTEYQQIINLTEEALSVAQSVRDDADKGLFKGEKGDKGDTGPQGIQGEKGEKGDTGPQGIQGEKGEKGDTGPQGVQGEKGEKGDTGPQGIQGEKGEKGDTGPQGVQGEKGDPGNAENAAPPLLFSTKEEKVIFIDDSAQRKLRCFTVYGETVQNGIPGFDGTVEIKSAVNPVINIYGKNICSVPTATFSLKNIAYKDINLTNLSIDLLIGKTCTLSCSEIDSSLKLGIGAIGPTYNGDNYWFKYPESGSRTYTFSYPDNYFIEPEKIYPIIRIYRQSGTIDKEFTVNNLQIELGDKATEYELYMEPQTAAFPYTLRGIPASEGGWVARDEIKMANGSLKYIQKISSEIDQSINTSITDCTDYLLDTPVETDITHTDAGTAAAEFQTNYNSTTLICSAAVVLSYVADTTSVYYKLKQQLDNIQNNTL